MGVFYFIISISALVLYGADKLLAKAGWWRVPEKWLLFASLLGGCFGAIPAMMIFRHKIRKRYFWVANGSFCVIHLVIIGFILTR